MVSLTSRLKLRKPATTDLIDIGDFNQNFDVLDGNPGVFICTSTTRPAAPFEGQQIYETDTQRGYTYRGGWELVSWPNAENYVSIDASSSAWVCRYVLYRVGPTTGILSARLIKIEAAISLTADTQVTPSGIAPNTVLPRWAQINGLTGWGTYTGFTESSVSGAGMNTSVQTLLAGTGEITFRARTSFSFPVNAAIWVPPQPFAIKGV